MARAPKPWFWTERQAYFVTVRGTRHNLGADKAEAERLFHSLMAQKPDAPAAPAAGPTVAEVCDKFLDWCQRHRAERTYEFYRDHLQDFLTVSRAGRLPAADLKPFHVAEWADSHGTAWSPACRRGAIVAAQRPFNWAAKMGHIPASPIPHVEKPRAQRRELAVTAGDWARIKASYPDGDPFADLLEFCWETGARPQEVKRLEARHVEPGMLRAVFPAAEAKGKRRPRVVRLTPRAAALLEPRLAATPAGPLFLNASGGAWTAFSMSCRFARLKAKLGVKFCGTAFRHGFATRKLVEGHDHLSVAELLGHANGRMLAETYQHLADHDAHLQKVLNNG